MGQVMICTFGTSFSGFDGRPLGEAEQKLSMEHSSLFTIVQTASRAAIILTACHGGPDQIVDGLGHFPCRFLGQYRIKPQVEFGKIVPRSANLQQVAKRIGAAQVQLGTYKSRIPNLNLEVAQIPRREPCMKYDRTDQSLKLLLPSAVL
jgi:hypothetical protein